METARLLLMSASADNDSDELISIIAKSAPPQTGFEVGVSIVEASIIIHDISDISPGR